MKKGDRYFDAVWESGIQCIQYDCDYEEIAEFVQKACSEARAEALEEAALVCEDTAVSSLDDAADRIRALKETL